MNKEKIEGYCYQEYEPTPDNPCEIKTIDLVEYNNLYLETNHYGRSQFVKEILILRQQLEEQKKLNEEHQKINGELREENKRLRERIDILKETQLKQLQIIKEKDEVIDKLKNEIVKDRMEQFDDYVIYLQNKYLEMLGEKNE